MGTKTLIFRHIQDHFEVILPVEEISENKSDFSSENETRKTVLLSVSKIFQIFSQTVENLNVQNLAFICNGRIFPVTQDTLEVDVFVTRVIYLVVLNSFVYDNLDMFDITLDEVSYKTANDWLNNLSSEEFSTHQDTIHLLSAFKATVPEKEAISSPPPIAAAGVAPNDNNIGNPAVRALEPLRRFLQILHWRLLLRMVILYLLFFHNREMKDEKKYVIIGMMVIAYILQTGILALLLERFQGNRAADNRNPPNPNAPPPPAGNAFIENIRQLLTDGFNIPRDAGIFNDFLSIFLSFFASLFPAWEVRVAPEPPQPPTPPPQQQPPNQTAEEKQPEEAKEEQKQD